MFLVPLARNFSLFVTGVPGAQSTTSCPWTVFLTKAISNTSPSTTRRSSWDWPIFSGLRASAVTWWFCDSA